MLKTNYALALKVQLTHLFLCILWNAIGLWQLHNGEQSIGPTASMMAIVVVLIAGSLLVFSLNKAWKPLYFSISLLAFLLAAMTIYGGLTKDHSLWPSEFWRFAGIAVNAIGALGFILAITSFFKPSKNQSLA
ncbi:hypothetical protein [Shewanella violacea]|uniref:Uncharacterized protein n=1 Tax=Shewanella violacea (strain JCM 10179 / CIP 106290 / LMG 19151 / DSS12) TaxID=637905 RepID=D4ZJW0_SHEVD|nr:hypothetical protein [Shewanella violacea]BAJ01959.1 hypothetical protein SVI_1988 [Shewanella violacea DSS12]